VVTTVAGELPAGAQVLEPVHGGDINAAYKVRLADGRVVFLKTRADAPPGAFAREARDLRWLGAAGALAVPEVVELGPRYLALEWVEEGRRTEAGVQELGRGLAMLHLAGAPQFGDPEGTSEQATAFGSLSLPDTPCPSWPEFYATRRLLPLVEIGTRKGAIGSATAQAVKAVCGRIEELCGEPEPPARLHGDLWWGNVLWDGAGRPWLIDPAAYGGHREVDLAMLALFGGLPPSLVAAYNDLYPLADGWQERLPLYQLAPLLVHAILFGGSYEAAALAAARRYR
jgi:fructosamine-3-kinase